MILMLIDHLMDVAAAPLMLRMGPTRLALPMFMVLSGWLLDGRSGPSRRRAIQLGIAVAASAGGSAIAGLDAPDILAVYAFSLGLRWVFWRFVIGGLVGDAVLASLLLLSLQFVRVGWSGYEPAVVCALVIVGAMWRQAGGVTPSLPSCRPVAWVGRHALPVFVVQAWLFAALRVGVFA